MASKKIGRSDIIGQQGVNLIERVVLDMGFLWHPTGQLEAGIDGLIEIRDAETEEVTNCILQVQSRATAQDFAAETDDSFEYVPTEKDLRYWLGGNAPVLLIRSRPRTDEAYCVSVKDYFDNKDALRNRKIRFDKQRDRFDASSREQLIRLALPKSSGLFLPPLPQTETLDTNLLWVRFPATTIYAAPTSFRSPRKLLDEICERVGHPLRGWVLKNKLLLSVHDLRQSPWPDLCESSATDDLAWTEWSDSDDSDRAREFVQLLNNVLHDMLGARGLHYRKDADCFFFPATRDLSPREATYQGREKQATRTVFRTYYRKTDPAAIAYCRHLAFSPRFRRYGGDWFLEITPTYYFTSDGRRKHRYSADYLAGIKRLEHNLSVSNHVAFWADYLQHTPSLFRKRYPFLGFGTLVSLAVGFGISDNDWLPSQIDDLPDIDDEEPTLFTWNR